MPRRCEISLPGDSQDLTGHSSDFEVDPALRRGWKHITSGRPLQLVSLSPALLVALAQASSQVSGVCVCSDTGTGSTARAAEVAPQGGGQGVLHQAVVTCFSPEWQWPCQHSNSVWEIRENNQKCHMVSNSQAAGGEDREEKKWMVMYG